MSTLKSEKLEELSGNPPFLRPFLGGVSSTKLCLIFLIWVFYVGDIKQPVQKGLYKTCLFLFRNLPFSKHLDPQPIGEKRETTFCSSKKKTIIDNYKNNSVT